MMLPTDYVNQSYLECNITDTSLAQPLSNYASVLISITNNYEYQYSESFRVRVN